MKRSVIVIIIILSLCVSNCIAQKDKTYEEIIMVKPDTIDTAFKKNFYILTDTSSKIFFGLTCGMGNPPEGKEAIQYFINKIDYQTIRTILHSQNREGRVYALEALMNAAKNKIVRLSDTDKEFMKSVLFSKDSINCCWTCHSGKRTTESLFEPQLKRVLYK